MMNGDVCDLRMYVPSVFFWDQIPSKRFFLEIESMEIGNKLDTVDGGNLAPPGM